MVKSLDAPQPCTVEELLRRVGEVAPSAASFELWVPGNLTLDGQPIDRRAALAIVFERVRQICEDFVPVGIGGFPGGELHRFEKWSEAQQTTADATI